MLSSTLAPSSANIVQRPKHLYEDESENIRPNIISVTTATSTTNTISTATITTTTTVAAAPPTVTATAVTTTTTTATIATAATTTQTTTNERTRSDSSGRSAALERAYVHDVYENCEEPVGPIRPRVAQFLAGLDAGSVVCDVGCGNGRYLNSCNPFIYTIGVDRCYRLTKISRAKGGEVAICDNLELPFRDESFDAVLSLAVVHHFATTERRVGAIRELARILRIGGRVIISVWALEQRHKRFESQDVLVPWQPPKNRNTNTSDDEDDDDFLPPYHAYTEDSTNSSRSAGDGDSSSLSSSSPGESCYSFVRRAIQKLAGGKKHPWFLESWNSKDTKHGSSLDYEDAKDLPIELRRLEDFDDLPEPPLSAGLKSRSLGSILNPPPRTIVRSRSSVPSLGAQIPETKPPPVNTESSSRRPKLVKQKQSVCDDTDFPLPEFPGVLTRESRILLRKQSSLNEELMAESRLREKERVRKRIQKQMSLNEAFLCRSLFTKRLQVIREGFTTKLKSSTGNLERVTKNGFVKIIQNIKGGQAQTQYSYSNHTAKPHGHNLSRNNSISTPSTSSSNSTNNCNNGNNNKVEMNGNSCTNGKNDDQKPRRHSRESGSDSSKDSSLQSDTSIESEDSFASVIYIPKTEQSDTNGTPSSTTINNTFKMPSVPTSPLVMPCPTPAHSPVPPRCKLQANMIEGTRFTFEEAQIQKSDDTQPVQKVIKEKRSKITRQQIKDLPPIPKFKKAPSFPIVRRISAAPTVPKLMSLEIFNPETDDLDSDSSEPSSPDSIDSVISALKPTTPSSVASTCSSTSTTTTNTTTTTTTNSNNTPETILSIDLSSTTSSTSTSPIIDDKTELVILENKNTFVNIDNNKKLSELEENCDDVNKVKNLNSSNIIIDDMDHFNKFSINNSDCGMISVNDDNLDDKLINDNLLINNHKHHESDDSNLISHQHLVDFAEKLSAQLLKELDENSDNVFNDDRDDDDLAIGDSNYDRDNDINEYKRIINDEIDENDDDNDIIIKKNVNSLKLIRNNKMKTNIDDPYIKKLNGEIRDLNNLREELRERRLMLANLNTSVHSSHHHYHSHHHHHHHNLGCGNNNLNNNNNLNSSLKNISTNQSDTIHEEDETAVLNDFDFKQYDDYDHNMMHYNEIDEEESKIVNLTNFTLDEKTELDKTFDEHDNDYGNSSNHHDYNDYNSGNNSCNSSLHKDTVLLIQDDELNDNSSISDNNNSINSPTSLNKIYHKTNLVNNNLNSNKHDCHHSKSKHLTSNNNSPSKNTCHNKLATQQRTSNESHQSLDSWENSNSTGSLDSPSVGGSATHHRYYHVFREGELDALINHHVASLHIVSSYYERASWCVVAEKVQVWTI